MSETRVTVAGKLIEKICHAIGVLYDPYGLRQAQRNYTLGYFDQILHDEQLTQAQKEDMMMEYRSFVRRSDNRRKIISDAQNMLPETAKPEQIEDSWILNFWDKAGTVTDESFQGLWSRLLVAEAVEPNSVSKRLLHNLSLMSANDANHFQDLAKFCFLDGNDDLAHPIMYIKDDVKYYARWRITTDILNELENFCLIETNYESGFVFKEQKILKYRNYRFEMTAPRIPVGNVRLTADGQKLFHTVFTTGHEKILERTLDKLQSRYKVSTRTLATVAF